MRGVYTGHGFGKEKEDKSQHNKKNSKGKNPDRERNDLKRQPKCKKVGRGSLMHKRERRDKVIGVRGHIRVDVGTFRGLKKPSGYCS